MPYPQDRTIRIGNIQARYWAEGDQGTPVVLIHGLGGYVETWWPHISVLAQEHRVYAVDLPGFGRTDKPGDITYNLPTFAQFIHDFMTALNLSHASLAGHSLGGAVALQFTFTYSRMVDRLVLVSSGGLGREAGSLLRVISLPLLGERLTRPAVEGSRSFFEGIVYDPALITDEIVHKDYELSLLPGAQAAFLKTLRGLGNIFGQKQSFYNPILQKLPTITQPTLVLWGREDQVVPVKHSQAARQIPNARLQIFEHCGHIPQLEHPKAFDQAVLDFLRD